MADSATWEPWVQTGSTEFSNLFIWEDDGKFMAEVEFVRGGSVEKRVSSFHDITKAREWCEQTAVALEREARNDG